MFWHIRGWGLCSFPRTWWSTCVIVSTGITVMWKCIVTVLPGSVTEANRAFLALSFSSPFRETPALGYSHCVVGKPRPHQRGTTQICGHSTLQPRTWASTIRSRISCQTCEWRSFQISSPAVLGSTAKGPTWGSRYMLAPLYPGWIPYPQKP